MIWPQILKSNLQIDLKNANKSFIDTCHLLGLSSDGITALSNILQVALNYDFTPDELYSELVNPAHLNQVQSIIDKVRLYTDDSQAQTISTLTRCLIEPVGLTPKKHAFNSLGAVIWVLIEAMAGGSKLGGGTENYSIIVSGAIDFAFKLMAIEQNKRVITSFLTVLKKNPEKQDAALPLFYLAGILLNQRSDNCPPSPQKNLVLKDFTQEKFKEMVNSKYGECLTQCAIAAKLAFLNNDLGQEWLEHDILVDSVLIESMNTVIVESRKLIAERVNDPDRDQSHKGHAHGWLMTTPPVEKPEKSMHSDSFDRMDASFGGMSGSITETMDLRPMSSTSNSQGVDSLTASPPASRWTQGGSIFAPASPEGIDAVGHTEGQTIAAARL